MILTFLISTLYLLEGPSCEYNTDKDYVRASCESVFCIAVAIAFKREWEEFQEKLEQEVPMAYFKSFYNITDLGIIVGCILMIIIRIYDVANGCYVLPSSSAASRGQAIFDVSNLPITYRAERMIVSLMGALLLAEVRAGGGIHVQCYAQLSAFVPIFPHSLARGVLTTMLDAGCHR